jgi:hypothetical protein
VQDSGKILTPSPVRHNEDDDYEAMHQHYEELKIHVTSLEVMDFICIQLYFSTETYFTWGSV